MISGFFYHRRCGRVIAKLLPLRRRKGIIYRVAWPQTPPSGAEDRGRGGRTLSRRGPERLVITSGLARKRRRAIPAEMSHSISIAGTGLAAQRRRRRVAGSIAP